MIVALEGNDTILGNGGNDTVCAGPGWDTVVTTDGDDWIDGRLRLGQHQQRRRRR